MLLLLSLVGKERNEVDSNDDCGDRLQSVCGARRVCQKACHARSPSTHPVSRPQQNSKSTRKRSPSLARYEYDMHLIRTNKGILFDAV
jgi:hypothetical protein